MLGPRAFEEQGSLLAQPRPGEVFSHYRIDAPIGAGGMGQVFVATDLNLPRQVALKVVSDALVSATDAQAAADFRRRFHHEAEALAQLDCDHVIRIYEHGEFEGTSFIATQYVAGGELGTLLRQRGAMPSDRAAQVCAQIAEALAEAHEVGIVHRDVKTSNVLIRNPDATRLHAVLCDFGIAHTGDTGYTAPGAVAGTWAYLAPSAPRAPPRHPPATSTHWAVSSGPASPAARPTPDPTWKSRSLTSVRRFPNWQATMPPPCGSTRCSLGCSPRSPPTGTRTPAPHRPHSSNSRRSLPWPVKPKRPMASAETGRRPRVNRFMLAGTAAVLVTALGAGALAWQDGKTRTRPATPAPATPARATYLPPSSATSALTSMAMAGATSAST